MENDRLTPKNGLLATHTSVLTVAPIAAVRNTSPGELMAIGTIVEQ